MPPVQRNVGRCKTSVAVAEARHGVAAIKSSFALRVNADGYSRNRVKVCLHRRCVPFGMKKSGTAEEVYKIYAFVSLGCFNSNKEFEGFFIIVTITGGLICKQKE